MKIAKGIFSMALMLMGSLATSLMAQDIFVAENNGTIGEYTNSGAAVHASLISGLSQPFGIAISGTNLFIANPDLNSIGEYTTSGTTINAALISGLSEPVGLAISGTNLFVANYASGVIGEYTTSGATVHAALISGLDFPEGLAISGTNLFVANFENGDGPFDGTIGAYTTAGAVIKAPLISGLSEPAEEPNGLAISGSTLFVLNYINGNPGTSFVSEYTTLGQLVNASLITGLSQPQGILISGNELFVANNDGGTIGEYTITGTTNNASLITGLNQLNGFAVITPAPPLNLATVGNQSVLFYPYSASGTNYILQYVTNVASTNWLTVTSGVPIIGVTATNNVPASFFRLAPGN